MNGPTAACSYKFQVPSSKFQVGGGTHYDPMRALLSFAVFLWLFACSFTPAVAQELGKPDMNELENWTNLYEEAGVRFSFIFYREGDNRNNGVVVRIDNTNRHPMRYRFTMVFRSDTSLVVADPKKGVLAPGEMTTGSADSLWWIPFRDGREISEVGMRGMEVSRVGPE